MPWAERGIVASERGEWHKAEVLATEALEIMRDGSFVDLLKGDMLGVSSLTTAELRLLPFLPTHLSLVEITERLVVSRNTVKTQAISIYRKFGVPSRGETITRMRELGLVAHL